MLYVSSPFWQVVLWFYRTDSLLLLAKAFRCSSPLAYMLLLFSPWYWALQVLHVIRFSPPFSSLNGKHLESRQGLLRHGLDFDRQDRRVCPPISTTFTSHSLPLLPLPFTFFSLLASVLLGVHGTNSTVEYMFFLYQFVIFLAFSFLLSFSSCHFL